VRKTADRITITAQLIHIADGLWLWSGSFEEGSTNLAQMRVNLSLAIAGAIQPRLAAVQVAQVQGPQPKNSEAYHLYLLGRYHAAYRTEEGLKLSADYMRQAVAWDAGYAPAFAGLADAHNMLAGRAGFPADEHFAKAEAAARQALGLDPALAEGHVALASIYQRFHWDWPAAELHFKTAIRQSPGLAVAHHWYAGLLSNLGRGEEAVVEILVARELDPLSPPINTAYGAFLYRNRNYDAAIEQLTSTIRTFSNYAVALPELADVYAQKGMWAECIATYQRAIEIGGRHPHVLAHLGSALGRSGNVDEAWRIAAELESSYGKTHYSAARIGYVYRGIGDKDKVFHWFELALQQREPTLVTLKVDPANDSLRSDPRFQRLLDRLKL
jgi:tetratricopeptide (TPR) repeat protein